MHLRRALVLAAVLATTTTALTPAAAGAAASGSRTAGAGAAELSRSHAKRYPLAGEPTPTPGAHPRAAAAATPEVGTTRQWLGLDDYHGTLYRKDYRLLAVGDRIEVWVALDLAFPAGDCRGIVEVTTAQAQALAGEYDTNILPTESTAFSVAPDRDGSNAQLGPDRNGNGGDYSGAGDRLVTLVDNIRDDNYYTFPAAASYEPGLFSNQFNELFDRNVLTLDAFDWLHRTGAAPPDDRTGDVCTDRPAQPRFYERTLAADDQHLLEYYQDPSEVRFIDDGLSDLALSLLGYARTRSGVGQQGFERPLVCFNGFGTVQTTYNPVPQACGGPQNSLTLRAENQQADNGNAWSFMLYLYDHYGLAFISALHSDGQHQGLAGVQTQLAEVPGSPGLYAVLHDVQVMNLIDRYVDGPAGGTVNGRSKELVTTPSLSSTANLANAAAYALPGAKPNGADYVGLRRPNRSLLPGRALTTVAFEGDRTLASTPLQWSVVDNDPDRPGDSVLFSGNGSNLDAAMVTPVSVPAGGADLTYRAKYGAEFGYDYAYTTVSTDGGRTYAPLAGSNTVDGPLGPALNGTTTGFEPQTFDLSAYAGQNLLLGFRYVSDGGVNEGGWLVDDIRLGGALVSDGSSLAPFDSPSEVRPTPVANFHVSLVGLDVGRHRALVRSYDGFSLTLDATALAPFAGYQQVVAIVAYDEPTEGEQQSARYSLTANGFAQRGG